MTANYWIKLYHETLDDPRMGRLPNNLWRRVIELALFAGEKESDGQLPPTADIAWRLRLSPEVLEAELQELKAAGFVAQNDNGWLLVNFAEQQAPVPEVERTRRHRERKKEAEYYDNQDVTTEKDEADNSGNESVTNGYISVTNGYIDKIRIDKDKNRLDIDKKPKKQKPKSDRPPPVPSFKVFVDITKCYGVTTYWRKQMAEVVGEEPEKLKLWEDILIGWTGNGWNPRNVKGQLECFGRGEIPAKERTNGHNHLDGRASGQRPPIDDADIIKQDEYIKRIQANPRL